MVILVSEKSPDLRRKGVVMTTAENRNDRVVYWVMNLDRKSEWAFVKRYEAEKEFFGYKK